MYNILFVCYGNICRSPMAEMIFKELIYKKNKKYLFNCASRATSMEELGNDIYKKAKEKLLEKNITVEKHIARKIKLDDNVDHYDNLKKEHNHFICNKCNKIYDVFEKEKNNINLDCGIVMNYEKIYKGICNNCVKEEK